MKGKLYICFLIFLAIVTCYEDAETIKKRFNFYKMIKQYSNNTMDVEYDRFKGLYCVANTNLEYGHRALAIPKTSTMCPLYLFPFKYEIIEGLYTVPKLKETLGREQKFSVFVLTYYILYFLYADHEEIRNYILDKKLEHYYGSFEVDPLIKESFPKIMLTSATMEKEHYELLNQLGFGADKLNELESVYAYVLVHLSDSDHYPMIYPWASDKDKFIWAYAIVMSRGMTLRLQEYSILEDIKNKKLNEHEKRNNDINNIIAKNSGAPCIIPFIDLCNHYQPRYDDLRDKRAIVLDTDKDYFINTLSVGYNYGDEMSYTYSNDPSNLIMYLHYGFTLRNNIFNFINLKIQEDKTWSLSQINLCKQLGCLEHNLNDPSQIPKLKYHRIKINYGYKEIVNYARVRFTKPDLDVKATLRQLLSGNIISYDNEMNAWLWYYKICTNNMEIDKYDIPKSIRKAQFYINKCRQIQANWLDDDIQRKEWSRSRHYEMIYKLDISYKIIMIKHTKIAINNIIKETYNEIENLKDNYL